MTESTPVPFEEAIHGVLVPDPYRWLEDRSLRETKEWIRTQQQRCDQYFANCRELDVIRSRVRAYLDIETIDQPIRIDGRYFYRRRKQGEEQACIYVRDTVSGAQRLLFDPSTLGPFASIAIHQVSDDGSLLAYELKQGGSGRSAIHILEVSTGRTLSDCVDVGYVRGFSFDPSLRSFCYCQEEPESHEDFTIRTHLFGSEPNDEICFHRNRTRGSRLFLIADEIHLGSIWSHQHGGRPVIDFWIANRNTPTSWNMVFANREAPYLPILRHGRIFGLSLGGSMNGSLVELSRDGHQVRTVIPQQEPMIRQLVVVNDRLYVNLLDRFRHTVQCWSFEGNYLGSLDTPVEGTLQLLPSRTIAATSLFYTHESFTQPPRTFELMTEGEETMLWHQSDGVPDIRSGLVRKSVYLSKDGTKIPISIVEPERSAVQLPEGPAVMTGYGGFGTPMTPRYSVLVAVMVSLGTVFLLPHIRGGGEFGKEWHDSARRRRRQVAFDDFIAAAEWACSQRLATPEKLAIFGGSNSGLLVGVAVTQRPDLFRAALCIAPLLDMVRYEILDQSARWEQEYGTVADLEDFTAIYAYSPYHHVRQDTSYPAMMFVSGDKDDRCSPAHVRKMAARLQEGEAQSFPVVVDYSEERGHSPALPLEVRIDALARRIAFLCEELDIPVA